MVIRWVEHGDDTSTPIAWWRATPAAAAAPFRKLRRELKWFCSIPWWHRLHMLASPHSSHSE
jgi:hypothetical protein